MRTSTMKKSVVYALLAIMSALFLLPLVWMVRSSLMGLSQIFVMPPVWIPSPIEWDNFSEALTILPFNTFFLNTMIIVVLVLIGTVTSSTIAAFGFSRIQWKGRNGVFGILLTAMMLPGAVTLIPTFLGWKTLGFYDTFVPLIVPAFFGGGIFNIFLLRQFYMTIPRDLDEAALVDGAGYLKIYYHVVLPLSRSAIIVISLFTFLGAWNDFFGPLIYLKSTEKFTLALGLQMFQGSYTSQWDLLMAASAAVVLPCVVVFLIGQRYFLEGISLTGLKG
ncbi:carbohydrate ABC transporter permease [Paenibacillus methanolicus]|uniref:Multiple sugar transport system permease protein n=1 Tax=Paenibacillus methanolicus TaxID=582686 RepID=A0A5S5CDF8_9BACL|nr:carbohydrate ABC transporter permease [Paenibacillus methanolicus]TYP76678.1 multiple sugar transport system permease protein [Paenibacillus methanolicus]